MFRPCLRVSSGRFALVELKGRVSERLDRDAFRPNLKDPSGGLVKST